jgi:pilus assembly protein TadC
LVAGQRFAEVMKNLRTNLGPNIYPICDILVSADRDGLPITSVLDQLSFHAHQERRRLREVEAKELPVRLLFPLVCCILPSFILLAMVPLLINSLTIVSGQIL